MSQQASNSNQNQRQLGNWITDYVKVIDPMSESPLEFNLWSAISVVSAVLKNNVWFKRGNLKIYPNQYIVLVGPPGVGKGTAIHPAHSFVRNPPSQVPLANYIMDKVTSARMIELLSNGWARIHFNNGNMMNSRESACIIQSTELRTLINSGEWMTDFLCEAWDRNEYSYETKNKGTYTIKNVCTSLIGACVPDFVKEINKNKRVINGGFTARTIFIFGVDKSKSLVWPDGFDSNPTTKAYEQKLQDDIQLISKLHGEITLDYHARRTFEHKYLNIKNDEHDSDVVKHFKSRQWGHILKVAMALSVAQSDSLIVDDYCMTSAITLVDNVLKSLDECFMGVGDSPLAEQQDKIERFIKNKGSVGWVEIIRQFRKDVTIMEAETIISTLCASQIIKEYSSGGYNCYQYIGPP